jgi:hypothetical protein
MRVQATALLFNSSCVKPITFELRIVQPYRLLLFQIPDRAEVETSPVWMTKACSCPSRKRGGDVGRRKSLQMVRHYMKGINFEDRLRLYRAIV